MKYDPVNHPKHYVEQSAKLEPIMVLRYAPFDLGNAFKYIIRAGHKNDYLQDLKKAKWYLECALETFTGSDDSIQWAAFYDAGWFGNVGTGTYGPNYVMSVGGGLIVRLTRYLSGNVYIGIPIGDKPEGASNCRVHFTITSNIL